MKLKRILFIVMLVFLIPNYANAKEYKSFDLVRISNRKNGIDYYISNFFNVENLEAYRYHPLSYYNDYLNNVNLHGLTPIKGAFRWEEPDYIIQDGDQYVNLLYDIEPGEAVTYTLYLFGVPNELEEKEKAVEEEKAAEEEKAEKEKKEQLARIVLTKENLTLVNSKSYDINIKNKIKGSTYIWTTSNKKVVIINKYGVVTGIKKGNAVITCTMTTPDNEIIELKCIITIK